MRRDVVRVVLASEFLGKAALVTLFSILAGLKTVAIKARLAALEQASGVEGYIDLAADVTGLAFMILLLTLTVMRLKPNRTAVGWEPRVSALMGSFLSFLLVALPAADYGPVWRASGIALVAIGMALSLLVLARLGRSFSVVPQARKLVTGGPYALVRHPLYLCEEIAVIGVVIIHFSLGAIAILVVQWLFQLRRMVNEERLLASSFPEYAGYAARTPRVIPRLSDCWAMLRSVLTKAIPAPKVR
jgi:protein-S-isoprenylcysteine O-methyltransferase Ste14